MPQNKVRTQRGSPPATGAGSFGNTEAIDQMTPRVLEALFASGLVIAAIGSDFSGAMAATEASFGGPSFRKGVWQFERTLERLRPSSQVGDAAILLKEQATRCVNPTEAMKETFKPMIVGNCHSAKPEKLDNRYVFPLRCDFMGPVSTVIEVESDAAYTEINELSVGSFPRKETVVARRIGDCDK